jgi:trehalose 6-phosphate synthase/phosphatase
MPQVIIVSNRLPVSVKKVDGKLEFYPSVGGLATGLSSYVKNKRNLWIGWPGLPSDGLSEAEKHLITTELATYNCAPVWLTQKQLEEFYNGYSNSILWPLCHNLRVTKTAQHERWWKTYRHVNHLFTEAVLSLSNSDSTVWVHDYQLLLVPEMLRAERPEGHIGFFMHIPFPDYRTFSKLPEARQVLEGPLGADLVGFHTAGYVGTFLDACRQRKIGTVTADQVVFDNRIVRVTDFPMGIDYEKYAAAGKSRAVKDAVKKYRRKYKGYKLIVTVDRLDPSKGLVERLLAYEDFLMQNPQLRGKVILSMVAAPSRTDITAYKHLKKQLDSLVKTINNQFGTEDWQPIDYIDGLPFEEITALFRVANVAFITPLKDGMNLVAKEFVASKHRDGVLILSETAGAAQELKDALLVDPKQRATVVNALQLALTMPKRELRRRLKRMQKQLANNTVNTWANNFIGALNQPVTGSLVRTRNIKGKLLKQMLAEYQAADKRLLLLDYDGTLTPLVENFRTALPSDNLMQLLHGLTDNPANDVVLISGRRKEDLEQWLGELPIAMVAEHGAFIKPAGRKSWVQTSSSPTRWKKVVLPILETYAAKTPLAIVEEKDQSLVWHYRQSPSYYAQKYAVILKRVLRPILRTYGLKVFNGNKILEIKDPRVNKGNAIKSWLDSGYSFVMAIGDDYIDEDMFKVLPPDAWSIKVGFGRTKARFRVTSYQSVRRILTQLTK